MNSHETENLLELYAPISNNDAYARNNNIHMLSISDTGAVGEMILDSELSNENMDIHGGALFTLADVVAGSAAYVWGVRHWGPSTSYTTANASINYMRPIHLNPETKGRRVVCTATLRKTGHTLCVIDVCLNDEKGKELCSGTFTGFYIDLERYRKPKNEEKTD